MFGFRKKKKITAPEPAKSGESLGMLQVYVLAYAAAEARGWPRGPVASEIAWRVLWLEQRRLPGLGMLVSDFSANRDDDPKSRGMTCPIIRGAFFLDQADELVAKNPAQPHVVDGPDAAIVLLPKVAQYAAQIGEPIRVSWVLGGRIAAQTVVAPDGQMGHAGGLSDILSSTSTGFALHGEPYPFPQAPLASSTEIPEPVLRGIFGFIGQKIMDRALKVHALFRDEPLTVALLHSQTAGERSNFAILCDLKAHGLEGAPTLLVGPGSTNDRICSAFASYGWFQPETVALPPELAAVTRAHRVTDEGKLAMPMILGVLEHFPPVRH